MPNRPTRIVLTYGMAPRMGRVLLRRLCYLLLVLAIAATGFVMWARYIRRPPNYIARYFGRYEDYLYQVGAEIRAYAQDHGGALPPNLDALKTAGYVKVGRAKSEIINGRLIAGIPEKSWNSYVYVADTSKPYVRSNEPLVLQEVFWPDTHERWIYVLFATCSADIYEPERALALLPPDKASELRAQHPEWFSAPAHHSTEAN